MQRAFDLAAHGQGARDIGHVLHSEGLRTRTGKHFQATPINHLLRNEVYAGTLVWSRYSKSFGRRQKRDSSEVIRVPHCHEPLVDKDIFASVQALLTSRHPSTRHPNTVASQYPLSLAVWLTAPSAARPSLAPTDTLASISITGATLGLLSDHRSVRVLQ